MRAANSRVQFQLPNFSFGRDQLKRTSASRMQDLWTHSDNIIPILLDLIHAVKTNLLAMPKILP
jgi:hypothetical protein